MKTGKQVMQNRNSRKPHHIHPRIPRRGFTLTELLIVMAILVLLVSMVGPRILGSKQKADINSVKTQISMIQSALERYAIDMNKFPSTEQGLTALISRPANDSETSSASETSTEAPAEESTETTESGDQSSGGTASNWDGPYLKTDTLPKDPWGNGYSYEYPPTHNKMNVPDIWSFGPDGQEGTDDDIVSWTGKGREEGGGEEEPASSESRESGGAGA
jgi:general secretion pathway protein G